MKSLVIYYSLEGNTRLIAENIANTAGADMLELKPKKDISSKGFMKYFLGVREAFSKKKSELYPFDINPQDYDLIFIGTPVWVGTYTPALNTFFLDYPLENKKIALFCCHGGGKGKVFDKMKKALGNNEILGQIDFQDPLKKNTEQNIERAVEWTKNMMQ